MGKLLMLRIEDDEKIEDLRKELGARTKIEVVRRGLVLLEVEMQKAKRIERWKKAAKFAATESAAVNAEMQKSSRLKAN